MIFNILTINITVAVEVPTTEMPKLIIENIEIDAEADNLDDAKEKAINIGALEAFNKLLHRIVPQNNVWKIEGVLKQIHASEMVENFEILKERMTSHSYKATYNYIFDGRKVKHLLNKYGIEYAEKPIKTTLIVPILHQKDNKLIIWTKNEWKEVWSTIPTEVGLMKFVITEDDLEDMELLDPSEALTEPHSHFEKLLRLYEVTNMTVIFATEVAEGLDVTIRFLDQKYDYSKYITIDKLPEENILSYYKRASKILLESIDSEWKGVRVFKEDKLYSSKVNIKLDKQTSWPYVQKNLEAIQSIKQIMLLEKGDDNAYVELIYNTPPAVLAEQLAKAGYIMKEGADKKYYLTNK